MQKNYQTRQHWVYTESFEKISDFSLRNKNLLTFIIKTYIFPPEFRGKTTLSA